MDIFELQPRLEALENLAREKFRHLDSNQYVDCKVNHSAYSPIKLELWGPSLETRSYTINTEDDLTVSLLDLEAYLDQIPDYETLKRQKAVKQLSDALEACDDAGIDTEPFREPFRNIYENLLEAPNAAAV